MRLLVLLLFFSACAASDGARVVDFRHSQSMNKNLHIVSIHVTFENVSRVMMYVYRYESRHGKFVGPYASQEYLLMRGEFLRENILTYDPGVYLIIFEVAGEEIGRKEITVQNKKFSYHTAWLLYS